MQETVKVFMKRKVMMAKPGPKALAASDKRLAIFKAALCSDFDLVLGQGEGEKWWEANIAPVAGALRAKLL